MFTYVVGETVLVLTYEDGRLVEAGDKAQHFLHKFVKSVVDVEGGRVVMTGPYGVLVRENPYNYGLFWREL